MDIKKMSDKELEDILNKKNTIYYLLSPAEKTDIEVELIIREDKRKEILRKKAQKEYRSKLDPIQLIAYWLEYAYDSIADFLINLNHWNEFEDRLKEHREEQSRQYENHKIKMQDDLRKNVLAKLAEAERDGIGHKITVSPLDFNQTQTLRRAILDSSRKWSNGRYITLNNIDIKKVDQFWDNYFKNN